MRTLCLVLIGVVVGWAASVIDWTRDATAEEPAVSPIGSEGNLANSYYLYTGRLKVDKEGVAPVPSRYLWSVETSWRGMDVHGNDLPDSRVMLRLYDPDHNFTALTAQMDIATAAKLQLELAHIVDMKTKYPTFQHRPRLYDEKDIPLMSIKGIGPDGEVILEEHEK